MDAAVLALSAADGAVRFPGTGARTVDGLTVDLQPLAHFLEPNVSRGVELAIRAGTHVQQQATAARHRLRQGADDLLRAFVLLIRHPTPAGAHGHAGLPGYAGILVGHMAFGGDVVLVLAAHGAVHHQQAGLVFTRHRGDARHVDVLLDGDRLLPGDRGVDRVQRPHLPAIEPEDVHLPVVRHQLLDLPVGEVLEPLPALGIARGQVVHVAVLGREVGPPVVRAVPIRLAEIRAGPQACAAEGIKDLLGDVGAWVAMEGAARRGDLVVRELGVEHAEAVVVLGGEHHVLHAGILRGLGPLSRIEGRGIEAGLQRFVVAHVLRVGLAVRRVAAAPGLILRADAPALHHAPLAVWPPVHQQAELQVLPLGELLLHQRIGGRDVGGLGEERCRVKE